MSAGNLLFWSDAIFEILLLRGFMVNARLANADNKTYIHFFSLCVYPNSIAVYEVT